MVTVTILGIFLLLGMGAYCSVLQQANKNRIVRYRHAEFASLGGSLAERHDVATMKHFLQL